MRLISWLEVFCGAENPASKLERIELNRYANVLRRELGYWDEVKKEVPLSTVQATYGAHLKEMIKREYTNSITSYRKICLKQK